MLASQARAEGQEFEGRDEGDSSVEEAFHPWVLHMDRAGRGFNGSQRNRLFLASPEGGFRDLSLMLGADSPLDGRALLAADFDGDLDEDLFVHNLQRARHQLWRNDLGTKGRAISVELRDNQGHPEAIGAVVLASFPDGRRQARLLQRGFGFASSLAAPLLFAAAQPVRLSVRWPGSSTAEEFGSVAPGTRILLVRGGGRAVLEDREGQQLKDPWPRGLRMPVGAKIPALELEDREGNPQVLALEGETRLTLWSGACAACILKLDECLRRGDQMICMDPGARREDSERLVRERGHQGKVLFASFEPTRSQKGLGLLVDPLRLPLPTTISVSAEGRILAIFE